MGGRVRRRRRRGHEHGAAPEGDRLVGRGGGAFGDVERDEADGDQPVVIAAEVGDGAVVRGGAAVQEVRVAVEELRRRERAEHELPFEAEEVEGVAALGRIERAQRTPTFARHELGIGVRVGLRVGAPGVGTGDRLVGQRTGLAQSQRS
jgi:hypothetical protein